VARADLGVKEAASASNFFSRELHEFRFFTNCFLHLSIPLKMAGIKRRQADDNDKTESKKLKTENKSDKKHALKMARKDSKSTKTPKPEGKENLAVRVKKEKKEKKHKKEEVEESEDEEMQVDEDEFQGFATSDPVDAAPGFRPLSDEEDSEEEEEKPKKKAKKADSPVAEPNPNNPNGILIHLLRS
jgi:hypothetical protein